MMIIVRDAKREDIGRIAEFQGAMALETEGKALDVARLERGIAAVFDDARKGFYIVAAADADGGGSEVVGSLLITYEWSDWRAGTYWWIQSVYVDGGWRRRGVYRALYEHILGMVGGRDDVCGVRLYVERGNEVAQRTYASLGMSKSHYDMYELDIYV